MSKCRLTCFILLGINFLFTLFLPSFLAWHLNIDPATWPLSLEMLFVAIRAATILVNIIFINVLLLFCAFDRKKGVNDKKMMKIRGISALPRQIFKGI